MTSDNLPAKRTINTSSNTGSQVAISKSTNQATVRTVTKSESVPNGENLSGGAFGVGDAFGGPDSTFGIGEFGGIDHFRTKTRGTITH